MNTNGKIFGAVGVVLLIGILAFWLLSDTTVDSAAENNTSSINSEQIETNKSVYVEEKTPTAVIKPVFDLVRISRSGTGIVAGGGAPGAQITLYGDGKELASVKAEDNGDWIVMLNEPLSPGTIKFTASSTNQNGEIVLSDKEVTVSVPDRETKKFLNSNSSGVVALLSPKDGKGPSRVLQRPGGPVFDDIGESLSVSSIEYGSGNAYINGKSLPRATVLVYLDDQYLGQSKATDKGEWTLPLEKLTLTIGQHRLRVDQTIGDGSVKMRIEQPFETGVPLDPSKAENGVIVEPGNTLWNIARQLYGSGVQYTMIFQENSEKIKDPDMIYPGQLFKIPTKNKDDK